MEPIEPAETLASSLPRPDPILSWFLGPKSENANFLEDLILTVLRDYAHWRRNYFPADKAVLSRSAARDLGEHYDALAANVTEMMAELRRNFPFYSPRYIGHQLSDVTMASQVGYFAGMLFNPNNVTPEAAPVTVDWEIDACAEVLKMLGFRPAPEPAQTEQELLAYTARLKTGFGWAHLSSGGTSANVEALWAARALAYFPLAARDVAVQHKLSVMVKLPAHVAENHREDLIIDLASDDIDEYRLLLLKPNEKIYLLGQLVDAIAHKANISPAEAAAQTASELSSCARSLSRGMADVAAQYPPVIFAPVTAHYSIQKAADVLGIGRGNVQTVETDSMFRMDCKDLERKLLRSLSERRVPIAVVAVLGTTEEGAIDPIHSVVDLRAKLERDYNASFWLHVDGAWGGYFRTLTTLTESQQEELYARHLVSGIDQTFDEMTPREWLACLAREATVEAKDFLSEAQALRADDFHRTTLAAASVGPLEYIRAVRTLLTFLSRSMALDTIRERCEVPEGRGLRTIQLTFTDPEPTLDDWVSLCQGTVTNSITMEFGVYKRNLRLTYGDRHVGGALFAINRAESVTVDPHKMGYVGYPCGLIAFQNDRIRHFLMQQAPYITAARHSALVHQPPRHSDELRSAGGSQRISVDAFAPFTLEGSRPGASAVALWLSTKTTPLNLAGHGRIVAASTLAARELYEWIRHWPAIAKENGMDVEYDLIPFTPQPPDTNLVIFGVKKKTSATLAEMNAVTDWVYDRFTIQPELGDREYSYSQPFFLSRTTLTMSAYPFSSVQQILTKAQIRSARKMYSQEGITVLRATVMNPYIVEMRRLGVQSVLKDFMTELDRAASAAANAVGR